MLDMQGYSANYTGGIPVLGGLNQVHESKLLLPNISQVHEFKLTNQTFWGWKLREAMPSVNSLRFAWFSDC